MIIRGVFRHVLFTGMVLALGALSVFADGLADFSTAVIVVDDTTTDSVVANTVRVLIEEVEKRTGLTWDRADSPPATAPHIIIALAPPETMAAEGFRITLDTTDAPRLHIEAADARATLYGAGHLLRKSQWQEGQFLVPADIAIETAPRYPLRGHQLGYRARGNTYAAWDRDQYEQYIRELALFGANAIENIPNYGGEDSPVHIMSRHEMNVHISDICRQYGLDFWMWIPATFDLEDEALREEALRIHEKTYRDSPRVDAVFFPGGDPGSNPPELVLPFLEEIAELLQRHHPDAAVWLSLQGFRSEWVDHVHDWLEQEAPGTWFGGLVHGPGSPDLYETRRRTPSRFPIRHYPDITHIVRCQYPHNQLDPVFSIAHTRQGINPQPRHSQFIHNRFAPLTNGFLTYSDGAHDNVNKMVWTRLGWNPDEPLREILMDYARCFLRPDLAADGADAILALEQNWEGPAMENGGITNALYAWERIADTMEAELRGDKANWRLQMLLLRATLDAYARYRLIYEQGLETAACQTLLTYADDPEQAMDAALAILEKAETEGVQHHLKERIIALADDLWHSIGLQSDLETYQVHSTQRGAVLEYLDTPLNSRYWIEDEFAALREMEDADAVRKRLHEIATWQQPGAGSFYDDLGNVGNSPNVLYTGGPGGHPMQYRQPTPGYWAPDGGRARFRYGWWHTMSNPEGLKYELLDPEADYLLRVAGYGDAKPRANGVSLTPTDYDTDEGGFKDFPVPAEHYADGTLLITFDELDESHLNWREWSRMAEVWLLKQ